MTSFDRSDGTAYRKHLYTRLVESSSDVLQPTGGDEAALAQTRRDARLCARLEHPLPEVRVPPGQSHAVDTANKGEIIGENTTSNELEMTFGQLVLDAWKYSSKYILASIEFLQDTSINANEFLGSALGTRIARITNDHFTTGTGSQPNGIVTAATSSGITTASNSVITYDNLVDVEHSIDPAYRVNSRSKPRAALGIGNGPREPAVGVSR